MTVQGLGQMIAKKLEPLPVCLFVSLFFNLNFNSEMNALKITIYMDTLVQL